MATRNLESPEKHTLVKGARALADVMVRTLRTYRGSDTHTHEDKGKGRQKRVEGMRREAATHT
jgi:hypothetical protein